MTMRDLRPRSSSCTIRLQDGGVAAEITRLMDDARHHLGFAPRLVLTGRVDLGVSQDMRADLLALLREVRLGVDRCEVSLELLDEERPEGGTVLTWVVPLSTRNAPAGARVRLRRLARPQDHTET